VAAPCEYLTSAACYRIIELFTRVSSHAPHLRNRLADIGEAATQITRTLHHVRNHFPRCGPADAESPSSVIIPLVQTGR